MAQTKIIRWLICGLAIALLAILSGKVLAHDGDKVTTVSIGEYKASLFFAEPAKAGGNSLHVQILNETGMPVSDARVEVSVIPVKDTQQHQENNGSGAHTMSGMQGMNAAPATAPTNDMSGKHDMSNMPGMGGMHDMGNMPGMDAAPKVALTNELFRKTGDYFGIITFSAAGHWLLNTHFIINGQMLTADFPVDVARNSTSVIILIAFAGLNALIIWAASVIKRKPVPA